jgi:hypothetical protein
VPKRSKTIKDAAREKLTRRDRERLAREAAKLDPKFEQAMAEEAMSRDLDEWPEYCKATEFRTMTAFGHLSPFALR